MKLHFFTVNDINDYRKNYRADAGMQKIFEEANRPQTLEELDQAYFYRLAKSPQTGRQNDFESEIYGATEIEGLRLDFNFGLRMDVPEGDFRVRITDADTERICFDKYISGGRLISVEKYFIRWCVEVFLNDVKVFEHTLNLAGQPVAVKFVSAALGDTLALLPYVREFKRINHCELTILVPADLRELTARLYPDLPQIEELTFQSYATYYPMMYLAAPFTPVVPVDLRKISMTRVGGILFGINYAVGQAQFEPTAWREIAEPYVCIGIQARNNRKGWQWQGGWEVVIEYLKRLGYRGLCIDKNREQTNDGITVKCPAGAEDFTGERPLMERANMLYYAEFFIGLSSGLSWLAHAVGCPVVMICGFSQDWFEFYTPYRVANRKVCNGCFNDFQVLYLATKCPYHLNTPRDSECQKKIPPQMVMETIERLIVNEKLTPPVLIRN